MSNATSIDINRPIDEVFHLLHANVEQWSIIVVEDDIVGDQTEGVGTRFHTVTEEHGNRMEFEGTVTAWDPPSASAIKLVGKMFDIDAAYAFEDLGNGETHVSIESSAHPKGIFKVIFFFMSFLMRKSTCDAQNKEFESLKAFCEAAP
jgi:hypothetical protein